MPFSPWRGLGASSRRGIPAGPEAAMSRASTEPDPVPLARGASRAAGERLDLLLRGRRLLLSHRDEGRIGGDLVLIVDVEPDELHRHLFLQRLLRGVDEQWPAERLVCAVLDGLLGRSDAAVAVVDLERLDGLAGLGDEREGNVGHRPLVTRDALDRRVVVLADAVVVGADHALFTVDRLGEVVVGTGVRAGAEQGQLLVPDVGVEILEVGPAVDRGSLVPGRVELVDRQAGDRVVRVHSHAERVVRNLDLLVLYPLVAPGLLLLGLDRPRGVGDVRLAVAELFEAAAGP